MSNDLELIGEKELQQILEKLPQKVDVRLLKAAARRAAKPLIKTARAKAPKKTGTLKKSIGTTALRSYNGSSAVNVGPRSGKRYKYDGWYANFVEFGTSGITRNNTKHRTKGKRYKPATKAKPFMRPAYDQEKGNMMKEYENAVGFVVQKYMDKQAAKMKK